MTLQTFETKAGTATIRLLNATEARPAFAFVGGQGGAELINQLGDFGRFRWTDSKTVALHIVPGTRQESSNYDLDNPLNTSVWGEPLSKKLGLPDHVIVMPEKPQSSRKAQLEWASSIAHECAHLEGKEEFEAYVAQDQYLIRNELPPHFRDQQSILLHLYHHYEPEQLEIAMKILGVKIR